MGQYWKGVIIKDKAPIVTLSPYIFKGNGAKLMEEVLDGRYIKFFEYLLANDFYGDTFVWCGDYSEGDLYEKAKAIQDECSVKFKHVIDMVNEGKVPTYRYLINISKKQYVDLNKCGDLHPLAILCSNSNGMGGGDYYGTNMELVGSWAMDKIGVNTEAPEAFEEVEISFKMEY